MGKLISTGEVQRVDGATYPVEYTYNGLGKQATMTTFKDANTPQVTSWTYNARGEMVQKTYADGNKVNYTYNADGQLLTRTWARGIVTTYTYDNAGRATGYSYSDGVTPAVVITFDFLDRQSSITDAAGMRSFSYGSDHLQTGETIPYISGLTQTYGYDIFKRQNQLLLGNHYVINYTYDVKGRPASIAFNGKTKNYSYVPGTSNLSGYNVVESGNSIMSASYSYDTHKRLTGITANVNGATYTHGYTLNDKNQRTGITLTDGKSWNFSYDNIGQVTGAMLNNSGDLLNTYSYNYDQIGNRIQAVKDNDTTSYTSNIVNQYTQIDTSVPTYDQDGNMLTNGEWSYTWNGENRMISAQTTNRKVEFAYDYMGRCFERKEYTAENGSWNLDKTIYIVYDEYKQIAEYVNGELYQQYVWDVAGLDTVAFMGKNNSTYMYWTDGNKNVLNLFDATGVQASYSYDPFGKVATSEGLLATDNPFRFSSEYHNDITGLVEYIYRKYDPVIGRWINRDPIEEEGGLNLYVMLGNNSILHTDTIGLGKFFVERKDIDLNAPGISILAQNFADLRGFSVIWQPSYDDKKKCRCGTFYLAQSISSYGINGKTSHVDATPQERKINSSSGHKTPPPKMMPQDKKRYSYYDSPSGSKGSFLTGITKFHLTVVSICVPPKRTDWFVIDSVSFSFDNNNRTLIAPRGSRSYGTGGFEAVGTTPGQHWINAENLWRGKTR